jgi:hypothetical protein
MKKVLTIIIDEGVAKEIFDEYYDLAEFISMESEDEFQLKESEFDDCDCEDVCTCDKDDARIWVDKRKVEI